MDGGVSSLCLLCMSLPPAIVVESRHFLKTGPNCKSPLTVRLLDKVDHWITGKEQHIPRKLLVNHNRNKQHGSKSTNCNLQTWPLKPTEKKTCFLRGPLEQMTQAKHCKTVKFFTWGHYVFEMCCNGQLLANNYVSWVLYVKSQTETQCLVKHFLYWKTFAINV